MTTDLTPAARHARLVAEIRRRLDDKSDGRWLGSLQGDVRRHRTEREQELAALLEIVERVGDWLTSYEPGEIAYALAEDMLVAAEKILTMGVKRAE